MGYYLGIDIGTSATKSVLFDNKGKVIASSSAEYPLLNPKPGYAEQNPLDWLNACKQTIKEITTQGYQIDGIGLSGQMHGLVVLDKNDEILRNSIIWCDNRTTSEKKLIEEVIGNERIKEITGNEAMAPFTLAKILWVKNNEPDIYKKIDKIMLPKDYIRYMLTGEFKTEYSDASGMQLLDIFKKEYSSEILSKFNISIDNLPKLIESQDISGYIKAEIADELGLSSKTFVVGGAGDQAASAIGNGIVRTTDLSIVLGSSGVIFNPITKEEINKNMPVQVFMHAIKDTYHIMGVTNGCGLSYKWYKEQLCKGEQIEATNKEIDVYEILNEQASNSNVGSNGLIYLPYLNGERTPHNDPYASGVFYGIRQNTSKNDFTRSVLEGISFSLREVYEMLIKKDYDIYISGGGAKGKLWREIIASNLKTEIKRVYQDEGGALGVAILAMVAANEYDSIVDAVKNIITIKDVTKKNEKLINAYTQKFNEYKDIYKALKPVFQKYK